MSEFKPQKWHVELRVPNGSAVLSGFETRKVADEVRDEHNAEMHTLGQYADAYSCLCDCPNRECKYL